MLVELIFVLSLLLIAYACVGYSALVFVWSRLRERPVRRADITPKVSVIIAAHNEERDIAAKIDNTLLLDYPKDLLEIIVSSDCSTDDTDRIVRARADRAVILVRQDERLGKTMAQNKAVESSTGDVLVFTDATTQYPPNMLRNLVRSFADPEVGCVSSNVIYMDPERSAVGQGCRSYWSYEKLVQQSESRLESMIGVTGCLYAVRRSSYSPLRHDMCSDFVIASEIRLKGLRTVYEPEAISIESTNSRCQSEFRMRVRIMEQTMNALRRYREVLSIRRYGLFAFEMLSHKVLRYAVPAFLLVAFISNLFIAGHSAVFLATMILQAAFYFTAAIGWALSSAGVKLGPFAVPFYFVLSNWAIVIAFFKFLRGEAYITWEPLREPLPATDSLTAVGAGGEARG